MPVLLDDFDKAHDLLDGKDSAASKFGAIRYYEDAAVTDWVPSLKLVELELRVSQMEEFRAIAFFHHLMFVKE